MSSNYPNGLDDSSVFPTRVGATPNIVNHAADHNNMSDAIIEIETELGTGPSVAYSTVGERTLALSQSVKEPCRALSDSTISTATPGASIDGVSLSSGDRVLLVGQSTAPQNGIWVWSGASSALTRPSDFVTGEVSGGQLIAVSEGTNYGNSVWQITSSAAITVDTTSISISQVSYNRDKAPVLVNLVSQDDVRQVSVVPYAAPTKLSDPSSLPAGNGTRSVWSPDGRFLAVCHYTTPYITIYERNGTTFTKLSDPASLPTTILGPFGCSWSPDSRFLAVAHYNSPYITIYERSGTTFTKLSNPATLPTGGGYGCSWSPDGRFLSVAHLTSPYITIYERSGTTFTKLSNPSSLPGSNALGCEWSPDGRFLSVSVQSSPYVLIYERSGTTFTKLSDPSSLPGGSTPHPYVWSPEGRFLAAPQSSYPYVIIYERSGTTFTKLSNPATLPGGQGNGCSWSPDGRYLCITHNNTPYLTVYERSGTTFTKLSNPVTLPTSHGTGAGWSPDGKFLSVAHTSSPYATIYESSGEIPAGAPSPIVPLD